MKYFLSILFVVMLVGIKTGYAQIYPDTLWVPVTFYDFHSNGSSPDFQPPNTDGVVTGMVTRVLGAAKKPDLGSSMYFSRYLKYWYRDWNTLAKGDLTRPTYNSNGSFNSIETVNHDTSYKNIVIQDSLPFRYIGGQGGNPLGTYEYQNDAFFLLDGRGFGSEGRSHNFAFTMELHWKFTKVPGLTFRFTGDDDVWAYINDTLRMDLGGIHAASSGAFSLDTIPGLVNNQEYSLDFFYAERHTTESHIRIRTNIISAQPSTISIVTVPSGPVCAGDTALMRAIVTDESGNPLSDFDGKIYWDIISTNGNSNSHLIIDPNKRGDTVYFAPTEAYANDTIRARLIYNTSQISTIITKQVNACYAHHLVIEGTPPPFTGNTTLLRNDNPLPAITIPASMTSGNAFAIVRDKFGNFIGASENTQWTIKSGDERWLDRVVSGNTTVGEGIVFKRDTVKSNATAEVNAHSLQYPGITNDNVAVNILAISYDSLQIAVLNGTNYRRIDSLFTTTDDDTLLIVRGKRSDNGQWEVVSGNWTKAATLTSSVSPPTPGQSWNFTPIDTGRGSIAVTSVANANLKASIYVVVKSGRANSISIFPNATGAAYSNPPFYYNDSAGIAFPLYAKIFDSRGVWLRQYDSLNVTAITWSFIEVSGIPPTGSFTPRTSGNQTGFVPTRAWNVVDLKATFSLSGRTFSDTVRVQVTPGRPDHITIQADTSRSGTDLARLDMQSNQTTALLYAILRDRYENFIELVQGSIWSSKDTAIVKAEATSSGVFIGEGQVTRNSDLVSQTWVYASNDVKTMKDSILVALTDITYDTLRIYTLAGGTKRIIDTIRVRTDSTLTLYVEGRRSDNQGWDNIPAIWTKSTTLKVVGVPPAWSDNWAITPDSVGNGRITVTRSGAVSDSVVAIFLPGLPGKTQLYRRTGTPASAGAYSVPPVVDTVTAGVAVPIVAKIFDRNNVWLSDYENSSKNALFAWTVELLTGFMPADTLNKRNGYEVSMMPTNAYNTYRITMTFTEGSKTFNTALLIYVKPGTVDHLVIEGNWEPTGTALQNDNPLTTIEYGNRDTVKYAYAILRDKFGNFVDRSQSTAWNSIDATIVTAAEGLAVHGEGRMTRVGTLGATKVVATNRNNTALRDTVDVVLSQFSYDSLQIVVNDSIRIKILEMQSDQDTVLQVIGKRSFDGVWVPVNGDWIYSSNNGTASGTNIQAWTFAPTDTGFGKIVVSRGSAVPDTVSVRINPGNPAKLRLYAKEGTVPNASNPPYPDPITAITATAGTPFPLVAKILDHNDVWLSKYEQDIGLSRQIKWQIIEMQGADSSGFLDDTTGHKRFFMPVRAYQSVYVVAEITLQDNRVLIDTVQLQIVAGPVKQLVIEGSSTVNRTHATPLDTAYITDSVTTTRIYAILRDSIGNFVAYSTVTSWGIVNNDTIISIRNGNTNIGEGVVSRVLREGVVRIFAIDGPSKYRDSTVVRLLPFYFKRLRIVVNGDTGVQTLTMNTNQDTTLIVQGLRSDSLVWVDLQARWENSTNLKIDPAAPGWEHSWHFSPSDTGSGWIRVTHDNDAVTKPDSIKVIFTPGPPTKVTVTIVTPPDKIIAGKPIDIQIIIENKDGRVPGTYCFDKKSGSKVIYTDTLGSGGRPQPFVVIGADTLWLAKEGEQCFTSGIDTVPAVEFYATDSLHRISVQLGNLRARTLPFIVHPGPLDTMIIEDQAGKPIGDTITLNYPKDYVHMFAVGYDKYGNRIGSVESNWSSNGTLHPIDQGTRERDIIYQSSNVTDNESGTISAVPATPADKEVKAKVFVKIIGPLIRLESARTRDVNGNGYLDQLELKFTKPIDFPKDYQFEDILIKYGDNVFSVDQVVNAGKGPDSVWIIKLNEKKTSDLQTDWVPTITFGKDVSIQLDSTSNFKTEDGAGPVVKKFTKTIKDAENVRTDEIRVVFSEAVQRSSGEVRGLITSDSLMLIVDIWEMELDADGKSHFRRVDSLLVGINKMQSANDTEIVFITENGADIAPWHYVSIRMLTNKNGDTTAFIADKSPSVNIPETSNQKVRVIITGPAPKLKLGPNPTQPTERYVRAGVLEAKHYPEAMQWVKNEKRGVCMQFSIMLPENADTIANPSSKGSGIDPSRLKIRCIEKIYDFVGNPVISSVNEDLVASLARDELNRLNVRHNVNLYWNCYSRSGRPAAPGVYKVVVYIEYKDPRFKKYNSKFNDVLGVGH